MAIEQEVLDEMNTKMASDIDASDSMFDERIAATDKYFQDQTAISKERAEMQAKNQQEQTDFAIEQINQEKDQAEADYQKEQAAAYTDYQKQIDPYGVNAEKMAAAGMQNTGYAESSKVAMYNQYQNRVMIARQSLDRANLNFENAMKAAILQNDVVLAEIAMSAWQEQTELAMQSVIQINDLTLQKEKARAETKSNYLAVLKELNDEENGGAKSLSDDSANVPTSFASIPLYPATEETLEPDKESLKSLFALFGKELNATELNNAIEAGYVEEIEDHANQKMTYKITDKGRNFIIQLKDISTREEAYKKLAEKIRMESFIGPPLPNQGNL